MTDKVQKIRNELARLKEETFIGLSEHENGVEQGRMEIIDALSLFLDSLQRDVRVKGSSKKQNKGDIQFPPPREKCKHCRNWLAQEDVGFNDYPHCLFEYDIHVSDYMSKLSDDCEKHLED